MEWVVVFLVLAAVIGSSPAIVAAVRWHDAVAAVGVLVVGVLGGILLVAGVVALMFNGYVEDTGMEPARTLPIAIPLLAAGALLTGAASWIRWERQRTALGRAPAASS